jgi:hypothetical protein
MTTPRLASIALALFVVLALGCPKDEPSWPSVAACDGGYAYAQRLPAAGLAAVETFSDSPGQITLAPNPALIDGNTAVTAVVDLGYTPSLQGDSRLRDLGVQLADAVTAVDALRVWVDRPLPPAVSAAYLWSAYRSDDNMTWTAVALSAPVTFGAFDSRFEIPIARTAARYLKVVTSPLAAGITADPAFADLFVTELEAFAVDVPPACAAATAGR